MSVILATVRLKNAREHRNRPWGHPTAKRTGQTSEGENISTTRGVRMRHWETARRTKSTGIWRCRPRCRPQRRQACHSAGPEGAIRSQSDAIRIAGPRPPDLRIRSTACAASNDSQSMWPSCPQTRKRYAVSAWAQAEA